MTLSGGSAGAVTQKTLSADFGHTEKQRNGKRVRSCKIEAVNREARDRHVRRTVLWLDTGSSIKPLTRERLGLAISTWAVSWIGWERVSWGGGGWTGAL